MTPTCRSVVLIISATEQGNSFAKQSVFHAMMTTSGSTKMFGYLKWMLWYGVLVYSNISESLSLNTKFSRYSAEVSEFDRTVLLSITRENKA